eukprot:CAMPEP_0202878210 /NCGR_PEP_ID=MMETSP1391-20130828/31835_1 /ASSEMBLY_ACC=CAM_ASM_000867 /TAXON_ID=1034604 /ORGANISM="Chlamydomonas leiostraca, Strain SAG 11-49" /LENGTH=51 /DNA_ID=CAMNT_0049560371 /DNA_START=62 /DNA_END=214 /DNA_ORIENTATION=-
MAQKMAAVGASSSLPPALPGSAGGSQRAPCSTHPDTTHPARTTSSSGRQPP